MKLTSTAMALLLASAGLAIATPAQAQYGSAPPAPTPSSNQVSNDSAKQDDASKPKVSSAAKKEIVDLQTAVNNKDTANIPAKVAAAKAKAKTKDDQYVIAQLQLKAAVNANDNAAMAAGLQEVVNSGYLKPTEVGPVFLNLGKLQYNAKAYDAAGFAFDQVLKSDPNNVEALVLLAETRNNQSRTAEAIGLIQKAIAARTAAGQKAEEAWYKRAVALSYNAKLPIAPTLAREWVSAYPNASNWRDTIRIYQVSTHAADAALLDSMRLARVTGSLAGENDYYRYASTLVTKGFPGEAKAVLDQGFAAKAIDRSKDMFSQLYGTASGRAQGDQASLAASAAAANAAPDAKKAMVIAEAYYGYGDYSKSADLLRAALGKSGVDKDLANLRLGMALAQAGDKAGATAALNAAGGAQADLAKLWLAYVAQKG